MNDSQAQKRLASNTVAIVRRSYGEGINIKEWETESFTVEARLAFAYVERWGMVQGEDRGEDSAGRAKIGLMPTQEVIDRAVAMAAGICGAVRSNGWSYQRPDLEEARELLKDQENDQEGHNGK